MSSAIDNLQAALQPAFAGRPAVRNLAPALLKHFERFFAFLRNDGVEPTNNAAERALRCAVQWRKTSFGSRSSKSEVAAARLLTVKSTCRMQNREPRRGHPGAPTCPARTVPAENRLNHVNC